MQMKRVAAILAAAAMAAMNIMTASAATTNTSVNGPASITFDKYLIMDQKANVPNITFNYTVEPGQAINSTIDGSNVTSKINAGIMPSTGTIAGTATFAPGDTTSTTPTANTSTAQNPNSATNDVLGSAYFDGTTQKYAEKSVALNFSNVTFTAPGVYRYVIKETIPSGDVWSSQGISLTDPSNNTLYLDVYIQSDASGVLSYQGCVMHRDPNSVGLEDSERTFDNGFTGTGTKATGFANTYVTKDLRVGKTVKGNQGDYSEYFDVKVVISGAVAGTKYDVDKTHASHADNPAQLTVGNDGTVTQIFKLQSGEYVDIFGLTPGTSYLVNEENTTALQANGYIIHVKDAAGAQATTALNDVDASMTDAEVKVGTNQTTAMASATAMGERNHRVSVYNYKNGVVPTGLIMLYLPYIGIVIGAGVAIAIFLILKRRRALV